MAKHSSAYVVDFQVPSRRMHCACDSTVSFTCGCDDMLFRHCQSSHPLLSCQRGRQGAAVACVAPCTRAARLRRSAAQNPAQSSPTSGRP